MRFIDLNIVTFLVILLFLQNSWNGYVAARNGKGRRRACYSAIYSFGDSLADTGNLLTAATDAGVRLSVANLPYGETYFGNATGRYSDGRLIVDYIAQASGLPFLDPYLNIANTSKFPATGVNFAVAGATALSPDFFRARNIGPIATPFSLDTQIQWFLLYKQKFCATFQGGCNQHFASALFLMGEIGGNDYNYPFFQHRPMQQMSTFVPLVVAKIENALQTLITVGGAKKILVQNNLPIGCSPSYLTLYTSSRPGEPVNKMGCMPRFNSFAKKGNDLLQGGVTKLQVKYPQVKIVFADYYGAALRILKSPQHFGLQNNVLQACCGTGGQYNYDPRIACGAGGASACANPGQYFNWDGIHLTDSAYGNIAKLFLHGIFTSPSLHTLCTRRTPLIVNVTLK
eukprot:PITA_00985